MEIKKNNVLIAEFLGYKQDKNNITYKNTDYWFKENESRLTFLSFDYDWNWLMKVVEKIEDYTFSNESENSVNVTIGATAYCTIFDTNNEEFEFIGSYKGKLLSVYDAVIQFIKWYNDREEIVKQFQITKYRFLEFYYMDGQDTENEELRQDLVDKVLNPLFNGGISTVKVEEIFENCNQESIILSYLENFLDAT